MALIGFRLRKVSLVIVIAASVIVQVAVMAAVMVFLMILKLE